MTTQQKLEFFDKNDILSLFKFFGLQADLKEKSKLKSEENEIVFKDRNNKPVSIAIIKEGVATVRNLKISDLLEEKNTTILVNHKTTLIYCIEYKKMNVNVSINRHEITIRGTYFHNMEYKLDFIYDEIDRHIQYSMTEKSIDLTVGNNKIFKEYFVLDPTAYLFLRYQMYISKEYCGKQLNSFDCVVSKIPIFESITRLGNRNMTKFRNYGIDLFFTIIRSDQFSGYFNEILQEIDFKILGVKEYIENSEVYKNLFLKDYKYIRKTEIEEIKKEAQLICSKFF